jgi:hypothetical protein
VKTAQNLQRSRASNAVLLTWSRASRGEGGVLRDLEACNSVMASVDIMKELYAQPVMDLVKNYSANKKSVLRILLSRIPFQIICYHTNGRRSLGRSYILLHKTVRCVHTLRARAADSGWLLPVCTDSSTDTVAHGSGWSRCSGSWNCPHLRSTNTNTLDAS